MPRHIQNKTSATEFSRCLLPTPHVYSYYSAVTISLLYYRLESDGEGEEATKADGTEPVIRFYSPGCPEANEVDPEVVGSDKNERVED